MPDDEAFGHNVLSFRRSKHRLDKFITIYYTIFTKQNFPSRSFQPHGPAESSLQAGAPAAPRIKAHLRLFSMNVEVNMHGKKWEAGLGIGVVLLVVIGVSAVFFRSKPMIEPADHPQISFISATVEQQGKTYDCDVPEGELPEEVKDALIALFLRTEIRNTLFPPPQTYTVSDDSVFICVKVQLDNAALYMNLCSHSDYNSAQFGDTHYDIVDHQTLYQDVYPLLSDVISTHMVER